MRLAALVILCTVAAATAASSREVVPAEKRVRPYAAAVPPCHDLAVLEKIASRFAEKEAKFWQSSLTIVEFERIRPVAWRAWGLDYIPRQFCTGVAVTSDGHRRRIDYSVREDLGMIGDTWGVEWCVAGLDRNWAYAPACRMARP